MIKGRGWGTGEGEDGGGQRPSDFFFEFLDDFFKILLCKNIVWIKNL